MFDTSLIHQQPDPRVRRRFAFAICAAISTTMFSGMMLSQYTADTQIVEQKILSTPAYHQSIPAAATRRSPSVER